MRVRIPSEFHKFNAIPTAEALAQFMYQVPSTDETRWLVIGRDALDWADCKWLSQVVQTTCFISTLATMDRWLKNTVRQFDPSFEARFRELFHKWKKDETLIVAGAEVGIHEIFDLTERKWLSDGTMDYIFAFFRLKYGEHEVGEHRHGRYLFIPNLQMQGWIQLLTNSNRSSWKGNNWDWMRDNDLRKYNKAYGFVCMNQDHWGVVSIDFKTCKIAFGDSFNGDAPKLAIDAVRSWLKKRLGDKEFQNWKDNVDKFPVRKQKDPGACGILAACAIEVDIQRRGDTWLSSNVDHLRVRYLRILTDEV